MTFATRLLILSLTCLSINQICADKQFAFKEPNQHQWIITPSRAPHSSNNQSNNQSSTSRASATQLIPFTWLMPMSDQSINQLTDLFNSITDPSSSNYQQFLDWPTLKQIRTPDQSITQPVYQYLADHGVSSSSIIDYGDSLRITARVEQVEAMFQTELHTFVHQSNNQRKIVRAPSGVRLPDRLINCTADLRQLYDIPLERNHFHVEQPADQTIDQSINQSTDQSIKQSKHHFTTKQTTSYVAPTCQFNDGIRLMTGAAFVKQQYNFPQSTNPSINQSVHLTVLGGFEMDDGPNGEMIYEVYSPQDINKYGLSNVVGLPVITPDSQAINDRLYYSQNLSASEATLDMSVIFAYSYQSNNQAIDQSTKTRLSLTAQIDGEDEAQTIDRLLAMPASTRPHVYSISYGYQSDSVGYMGTSRARLDGKYMQLGLSGVTVVVSSGDDGASGHGNTGCTVPPPNDNAVDPALRTSSIVPGYPASSPYVLTVGATDFLSDITNQQALNYFSTSSANPLECGACSTGTGSFACQTNQVVEQAVRLALNQSTSPSTQFYSGFTSGGGFSSYATRPSWQANSVGLYLNTSCTSSNRCALPRVTSQTNNMRGYPDVAAFGGSTHFLIWNDLITTIGGTSLSSPLFAAVIGELVKVSLQYTGRGLGFVNPLLYKMYDDTKNLPVNQRAFRDITVGDNVCPRPTGSVTPATCYQYCSGYYAAPGWDPVTGLGTPNLTVMIDYMQRMYASQASSSSSSTGATARSSSTATSARSSSSTSSRTGSSSTTSASPLSSSTGSVISQSSSSTQTSTPTSLPSDTTTIASSEPISFDSSPSTSPLTSSTAEQMEQNPSSTGARGINAASSVMNVKLSVVLTLAVVIMSLMI